MHIVVSQALVADNWAKNVAIQVQDGLIQALQTDTVLPITHAGRLLPGFVDLQVNGGGGVLFNQQPNLAALKQILRAHRQFGTTAMLPTLITDSLETMQRAADAISEAQRQAVPGVLGVHFEGPHLSLNKKGIHPPNQIRAPSDQEMALFCRSDLGKVLVTLAPETAPPAMIRELHQQGVQVCLGHSNATHQQVIAAIEAGASGFTHLFNAMSPLQAREPGMLGTALAMPDLYAGLILDNEHVHPLNSQVAFRLKGTKRLFLVTDAMGHVGSKAISLPYANTEITRHGQRLQLSDGTLAGSCLDMHTAFCHAQQVLGASLVEASQMSATTPATFLGLQQQLGSIQVGARADFVLLDQKLNLQQVWQGGLPCLAQESEAYEH